MKSMFVAALVLAAVGCGRQAADTNSRPETMPDPTWERTVACAQRGDLVATELSRVTQNLATQVSDWQTHYNSKTKRCYLLLGYFHGNAKLGGDIPLSHQELLDAFERREVAAFTSHRLDEVGEDTWCRQTTEDEKRETSSPPCREVGQFVARLMRE